jgi:hypothetical protein
MIGTAPFGARNRIMPELPQSHRMPQPSPRVVANVRKESPTEPRSGYDGNPNPPLRSGREGRPATVFVAGSARPVVNCVAYALAEIIDLTPFWLDVHDSTKPAEGPDPGNTGWIPPDRMFVSEGERGFRTNHVGSKQELWTLVRSDEPASVLSHLNDFLRLPDVIQEILSATAPAGGPKAVVVANSDRVAHLFPRTAAGLERFLGTMAVTSLNIVAAHTGRTGPGRYGFATVFRVNVDASARWMEGTIVCEQGIAQGPFAVGRSNRLSDVPGIARVCSALFPDSR